MALMLFLPAWTLRFWEAWIYWLLFSVLSVVVTLHILKHDPRLVESRLRAGPTAEREKSQKVIQRCGLLHHLHRVVARKERHRRGHFDPARQERPPQLVANRTIEPEA